MKLSDRTGFVAATAQQLPLVMTRPDAEAKIARFIHRPLASMKKC